MKLPRSRSEREAFYVEVPENLPYGLGNPDYEYDGKVAKEMDAERVIDKRMTLGSAQPISSIGKHLAETLNLANEAAKIHIRLGRQQFAEEARRILNTETNNGRAIERIFELCNREIA